MIQDAKDDILNTFPRIYEFKKQDNLEWRKFNSRELESGKNTRKIVAKEWLFCMKNTWRFLNSVSFIGRYYLYVLELIKNITFIFD